MPLRALSTKALAVGASYCGAGCVLVEVFGRGNVGFLLLTMIFMLVEFFICMAHGFLTPDPADDLHLREVVEFWVKRAVLLALPLVGAGVDWAWYWGSEPDVFLGRGIQHYAAKTMCVAVVSYQLREVIKAVLKVWKNLPMAVLAIRLIDRIRIEAMPDHVNKHAARKGRRTYDSDERLRQPYKDIVKGKTEDA